MNRAARISCRLLTALSLLLLLATAGVWVRSYWVSDVLIWADWSQDRFSLSRRIMGCSRGGVQFISQREFDPNFYSDDTLHYRHRYLPPTDYPVFGGDWGGPFSVRPERYAALGFEWIPRTPPPGPGGQIHMLIRSLTLPLYFPCMLFAILPAHYLLRLRRRRRIAKRIALGCCIHCGYDLRASSGRCPECGKVIRE